MSPVLVHGAARSGAEGGDRRRGRARPHRQGNRPSGRPRSPRPRPSWTTKASWRAPAAVVVSRNVSASPTSAATRGSAARSGSAPGWGRPELRLDSGRGQDLVEIRRATLHRGAHASTRACARRDPRRDLQSGHAMQGRHFGFHEAGLQSDPARPASSRPPCSASASACSIEQRPSARSHTSTCDVGWQSSAPARRSGRGSAGSRPSCTLTASAACISSRKP